MSSRTSTAGNRAKRMPKLGETKAKNPEPKRPPEKTKGRSEGKGERRKAGRGRFGQAAKDPLGDPAFPITTNSVSSEDSKSKSCSQSRGIKPSGDECRFRNTPNESTCAQIAHSTSTVEPTRENKLFWPESFKPDVSNVFSVPC